VHRGRGTTMHKMDLQPTRIVTVAGVPAAAIRLRPLLPADPGRSEVEVLRDGRDRSLVLTEDGGNTVEAVYESTTHFIEQVSKYLVQVWLTRRARPQTIPQPVRQWPKLDAHAPSQFAGYEPGTVPFDIASMTTHPLIGKRLQAAALTDDLMHLWDAKD
jgi:hypothetical protein